MKIQVSIVHPTRSIIRHSIKFSSRKFSRPSSTLSPNYIRIVDVSPRDGLQNEKTLVSSETKLELIDRLTNCGLKTVEATAFVSPKWVPQMGDAAEIYPQVVSKYKDNGVSYPVLVPNVKGLYSAIDSAGKMSEKVGEIAIFGAASEGFSRKNTNRSIEEGYKVLKEVVDLAKSHGIKTRGYLSTVIACPYDGPTKPALVAKLSEKFLELGCYEVSLGDTTGVGTPGSIDIMLKEVLRSLPAEKLAMHAHDTYGQGVANVVKAVEMGIRVVDSSVAGLGGCPYAKGASGNVSTEDVVYALQGLGFDTGINMEELCKTGQWISEQLGRPNGSKAGRAILAKLT